MTLDISSSDVLDNLSTYSPDRQKEILEILHNLEDAKNREKCKKKVSSFCQTYVACIY